MSFLYRTTVVKVLGKGSGRRWKGVEIETEEGVEVEAEEELRWVQRKMWKLSQGLLPKKSCDTDSAT